ncbi:MAG TPA: hypothetical protein VHN80_10880, partial [Kineosporiaceae bacterium]|nr:hypothetical protein [Kineosporiaceae bacterium]
MINQQVDHLANYLATATKLIENPTAGTAARVDRDHVTSHPQRKNMELLWGLTCYACTGDVASAHEHRWGIGALIAADELLPLPALAVSRSVTRRFST